MDLQRPMFQLDHVDLQLYLLRAIYWGWILDSIALIHRGMILQKLSQCRKVY